MGKSTLIPARMGWVAGILLSIVCALLNAGCGGSSSNVTPGSDTALAGQLPWPPPAARVASGVICFTGDEYSQKNEGSTVIGSSLDLVVEEGMGWGIYTFADLPEGDSLANILVIAEESEDGNGGDVLFVGLANYQREAWDWMLIDADTFTTEITAGEKYVSPGNSASLAVVYCGSFTARIRKVEIGTALDWLRTPQNLAGVASLGQVALTWDEVDGATGYLVERDTTVGFVTSSIITSEPVSAPEFTDTAVTPNTMYYYRVIATDGEIQSAASDYVDVHVPQADLPMPENLRVSEWGLDYVKLDWDWSSDNPSGFDVFVNSTPDAQLGSAYFSMPGFMRTITVDNLQPGDTVYVRVAAYNSSHWLGPATDDVAASTLAIWEWTAPQVIGPASSPVSACLTPDGCALAYVTDAGIGVAEYDGADWSTTTAYAGEITDYVGIAATPAGKLIAVGHESDTDNLVCGISGDSSWTEVNIHGDDRTDRERPRSGYFCGVAAGTSEVLAWHFDEATLSWRIHRADLSDNSWSQEFTHSGSMADSISLAYNGDDAAALLYQDPKLQYGDEAGSWAFSDALDSSSDGTGAAVQLFLHGTQWEAIALSSVDYSWYYLTGSASTWASEEIGPSTELGLAYTQPILLNNEPAYCTYHTTHGWNFDERKSDWLIQSMGNEDANATSSGTLAVLDGVPYFFFVDPADDSLKYMTGIAPE